MPRVAGLDNPPYSIFSAIQNTLAHYWVVSLSLIVDCGKREEKGCPWHLSFRHFAFAHRVSLAMATSTAPDVHLLITPTPVDLSISPLYCLGWKSTMDVLSLDFATTAVQGNKLRLMGSTHQVISGHVRVMPTTASGYSSDERLPFCFVIHPVDTCHQLPMAF